MRKKSILLIMIILFVITINTTDTVLNDPNVTGFFIGIATRFIEIMRMLVKQFLYAIADML